MLGQVPESLRHHADWDPSDKGAEAKTEIYRSFHGVFPEVKAVSCSVVSSDT